MVHVSLCVVGKPPKEPSKRNDVCDKYILTYSFFAHCYMF